MKIANAADFLNRHVFLQHILRVDINRQIHFSWHPNGRHHCPQNLVQKRRARRLQLEMKSVIAFEPKHRRFGGTENAQFARLGVIALYAGDGRAERRRQAVGKLVGRFLVFAANHQAGQTLVGRILVQPPVS